MIAMAEPLVHRCLPARFGRRLVTEKIQRFATFPAGCICQHHFQKTHSLRELPDTFARREGAHRDTLSLPLIAWFQCALRLPLRWLSLGARWPTGWRRWVLQGFLRPRSPFY